MDVVTRVDQVIATLNDHIVACTNRMRDVGTDAPEYDALAVLLSTLMDAESDVEDLRTNMGRGNI